ncbi:WYL domain-containing protein [Sphingobacterium sp. DK4209]|uniref:WYL domain-containing protein n=1 Tax=Sphingobacterium zhuxiongii TaxID=2662364 RepID=A0A5Q0QJB1_9SPHI|nr:MULTISPECIES: WYL domain-containing protein [unclassified Sphingobacterium]MVZ66516.1 WYL domain-containing protein [Sphingobacterium sp. DK4209]QGA27830.1 WYL domain-containing protein [Sphingobacterium sp. dk4302]
MSVNKLALIRYKIIDKCLRQSHRKWTLDDLIEKVSDELYELEGIHSGISKRTIQGDIQIMRSNKLSYNAPIVVTERKYYSYSDPNYSISNSPISNLDIEKIKEVVDVLKHLNGFAYFEEMSDLIVRLENNLSKTEGKQKSVIQMESNKLLKGLEWITPLHKAIREEIPLLITYKSFKSKESIDTVYYPYLLKEYRNRWFVICLPKRSDTLITLALDRIVEIQEMAKTGFISYEGVDFERYFDDTIGVSKSPRDRGQRVIIEVDTKNAPYVETKPIHHSQTIVRRRENGNIVIRIDVVLNYELEREILGFGENMTVISPSILRKRINSRLQRALKHYDDPDIEPMRR